VNRVPASGIEVRITRQDLLAKLSERRGRSASRIPAREFLPSLAFRGGVSYSPSDCFGIGEVAAATELFDVFEERVEA
jgi:hypothetical protein